MDFREILRQNSKIFLLVFNLLFAFIGIIIISAGTTLKAHYHEYELFLDGKYFYASDFMIVVGVTVVFIAFFGCCGAWRENACMANCFSSMLIIILILEILVAVAGILMKSKAEGMIENVLYKTIAEYDKPEFNETTDIWDKVQNEFHCCGVRGVDDWNKFNNITKNNIPVSCCQMPSGTTNNFTCTDHSPYVYRGGCLTQLTNFIEGHAMQVEGIGIGVALFQVLCIMASCYLSNQIRSDYETV